MKIIPSLIVGDAFCHFWISLFCWCHTSFCLTWTVCWPLSVSCSWCTLDYLSFHFLLALLFMKEKHWLICCLQLGCGSFPWKWEFHFGRNWWFCKGYGFWWCANSYPLSVATFNWCRCCCFISWTYTSLWYMCYEGPRKLIRVFSNSLFPSPRFISIEVEGQHANRWLAAALH